MKRCPKCGGQLLPDWYGDSTCLQCGFTLTELVPLDILVGAKEIRRKPSVNGIEL